MISKLHNKIEIKCAEKKYVFYNTMLKSVKDKIKNLESYFNYISFGVGQNDNTNSNFKLGSFLKTFPLEDEIIQSNPEKGDMFIKKFAVIDDTSIDQIFLTEAGITSELENNPTIYNYFLLKSEDNPSGIVKEKNQELVITITIFLRLIPDENYYLTLGNNKFVELLLGQGVIEKNIFAARGKNLSLNEPIYRETFNPEIKFPASITFNENDEEIEISFRFILGKGETNEIVLFFGDSPFLRINAREYYQTIYKTISKSSQINRVIDLGENVKTALKLTDTNENIEENNFVISNYANDFGDKVSLPFHNLFDNQTPRFLSKDGSKIFFVSDDKVFGFINENYIVKELKIEILSIKNITKVIALNDMFFVISKSEPFVSAFILENEKYINFKINYSGELLSKILDIDITEGRNNCIMFGIIDNEVKNAHALYFSKNNESKTINFINELSSEREYAHILAMYKNNFSDSLLIFIKIGENSATTRNIYYFPNQTVDDVYSTIAFQITQNARELYVKSRAIVVEKTTNPSIWVYFYPEWFKYTLSISDNEENNFISTNLKYLIKKHKDSTYQIFNLLGYNNLTEFKNGLPIQINQNKILDFEFLNDTLLIFMNDSKEPIVAFNLYETSAMLENVNKSETNYLIETENYNLIGKENEGVAVTFSAKIMLWFFLKKFINLHRELMQLYLQMKSRNLNFLFMII